MVKIPVFLASDDNFAPFVGTTMASILMHTKEFIDFYILDCGISKQNRIKITNTKKYFKNFSIEFIEIDTEKIFKDFPSLQYITKAMFARYLIPEIKPKIKKAIYSDIDVAFVGDIKQLWNENLENYPIGAVPSQRGILNNNYKEIKEKLNLSPEHDFFMSGLFLLDCEKLRENKFSEKLLNQTKISQLPDQEIYNIVFNNNYKKLDVKYCVIYKIFQDVYSEEQIKNLKETQVIIHYPGGGYWKPWNNCSLLSTEYFWNTVSKTNFKKEIININKNFVKRQNLIKQKPFSDKVLKLLKRIKICIVLYLQ